MMVIDGARQLKTIIITVWLWS